MTHPSVAVGRTPRFDSRATAGTVAAIVGIVGILLLSGAWVGSPVAASASHVTAGAPPATVLDGTQLQQAPFSAPAAQAPATASHPGSRVVGPANGSQPIMFTVGFPMRNSAALQSILDAQAMPGSPYYRHWLTLDQEEQMFGPDPTTVQETVNYFTSLGFHVQTRGMLSVSFTGSVDQVNQAFRTQMVTIDSANGTSFVGNALPLSLPAPIAAGIATVNGLDTYVVAHPEHFVAPSEGTTTALTDSAGSATQPYASSPTVTTNWTTAETAFNFTNHAFMWIYSPHHHYDQMMSVATLDYIYNAMPLLNQGYTGNSTGSRITIAIVMAGGINTDDLETFSQIVWGNPYRIYNPNNPALSRLSAVPVDGSFTTNGSVHYVDGASGEMALDIEYSSTMAPGARIMPVYGPCLCTNVLDDDYATILGMTTIPNIVSNSWGGDEDGWPNLYGPNWNNVITMHNDIMLIDARGSSVLASSGDGGGFDVATGMLAPSYPASDPYILSVDGLRTAPVDSNGQIFPTSPDLGSANITISEEPNQPSSPNYLPNYPVHIATAARIGYQQFWYVPYSNYTLLRAPPAASGGMGTSYWFNQSWWQHGLSVPDLGRSLGSGVAAEADFNETIFFDGGYEFFYGGTSFACPTTAGEFALVDDYLLAHGMSPYLGNGNVPVFDVANAWYNGNLTLTPFSDVRLGTSFWANQGEAAGWSWPPGQKFPHTANGYPSYGNTTVGWDFPTGWGSLDVYNFTLDLYTLEKLPGQIGTVSGGAWAPQAWADLALNHSYTVHVNTTPAMTASNPLVTVIFTPDGGSPVTSQPTLTYVTTPANGYDFTLDTSSFTGPGYLVVEVGNSTTPTLGFAYSYVAQEIPVGTLSVTVTAPSAGSIPGGYPEYNTWLGFFGIETAPQFGPFYPNTFTVHVTLNGRPVYDAVVTASVANTTGLPGWAGSQGQRIATFRAAGVGGSTLIMSQTFTNLTGDALVYTWNVYQPTPYLVHAVYGANQANTTYSVTPPPNVSPWDNYAGSYSQTNMINYLELYSRPPLPTTDAYTNLLVPNSVNQSDYYSLIFAWQGEQLQVHVNNYLGNTMSGVHVWLGNYDGGYQSHFYRYQASFGLNPVTNASGTSATTNVTGFATIHIPDNQSTRNAYFFVGGPYAGQFVGLAFVGADVPGQSSRTFQYTEPCSPSAEVPVPLITCMFNDSFQRNYTGAPMLVFPNPITPWTQTPGGVHRDFFNLGATIGWGLNVSLPFANPWLVGYGTAWSPGLEHITTAKAYVDGVLAGDLTPPFPGIQNISGSQNLSGSYAPGVHVLTVVVTDSIGHTFTANHTFVVGDIAITDLSQTNLSNTYTLLPFNLTWSLDIPANEVNNHTFNQSLEIDYITAGCGGDVRCPQVVNYTEKIHDGQTSYLQSLNLTLLNLNHFYSGAGGLPPGQYRLVLWLNANHSGSTNTQVTTYFVFSPLTGAIEGPGPGATVPLGNLTISYTYAGQYISGATIYVFDASNRTAPIYTVGAVVPGIGTVGGARTWTSVQSGPYIIELSLETPYSWNNISEEINVTTSGAMIFQNATAGGLFGIGNIPAAAALTAVVGAIVGLLVGRWVLGRGGARPHEEEAAHAGPASTAAGPSPPAASLTCPTCKESFETAGSLRQHRQVVHGESS